MAQELNPTCLAGDILREFKRAGIEPGAAVDGGASGQGAGVGQRGSDQGLGGDTVGGRAHGAGCRYAERGCHAGQHRIGVRAGEDRPAGSEVQAKELVGGAVGIGRYQIKYLRARVVRRDGGAADDTGGGVECQARGQHAIGDDGQVIDGMFVVGSACGGPEGELPVGPVSRVDSASQVDGELLRAVIADGQKAVTIQADADRFGRGGIGVGHRGDHGTVPAHIDARVLVFNETDRQATGHHAVVVAGGGGRHDAVVEAGAVGAGTATHQVVEAGGERTGAVSSQLGQDQATVLVVGRRGQHAFAARDGGGTPQGPTGGQGGEIGCEKGVLGDRVSGRTAGGGGERPGNTCGKRGAVGAGEDRRPEGEARGVPRLGETAGGGLDLPGGVFQRQVAALGGGTGEVGAGGHIGAGQPGQVVDKGAPIGRAGHGAAVKEHIRAGSKRPFPTRNLVGPLAERLLVEELVTQQQGAVAAVADDAHGVKAGD